ncbi:aftiphilin a isoform X3 [Scophthalmus maximus]|nr:aftiphilin a isoform X3 [Scophthalmus maximus]
MEPDVIRMFSSSPPPMEDGTEEEDDEFGDFGTFSNIPNSVSFTEFDTPIGFNQNQALTATSPPELLGSKGLIGLSSSNGARGSNKANGVVPASHMGGSPSERTEIKKINSHSQELTVSDTAGGDPAECNGGGTEVLTNGFVTSDLQGSPSSLNSVHFEDTGSISVCSPVGDFADFTAFSEVDGGLGQTADEDLEGPTEHSWAVEASQHDQHCPAEQGTTVRDLNRTGPDSSDSISAPSEARDGSDRGPSSDDDSQRDVVLAPEHSASEAVCAHRALVLNRDDADNGSRVTMGCSENDLSQDEKGSGTETETSFGRPLSTDTLEEYGYTSTTGSVPSPPLQGEPSTPADHSQLAEDGDFGDFGDSQGFVDFDQQDQNRQHDSDPAQEVTNTEEEEDDFGDFNSPRVVSGGEEAQDGREFSDFPVSNSFGNFSSAAEGGEDAGWSAFGEQAEEEEEESWAAFSSEQNVAPPAESREEEEVEEWHESEAPPGSEETDGQSASLSSRLLKLFHSSFPQSAAGATLVDEEVMSLRILLEPAEDESPGAGDRRRSPGNRKRSLDNGCVRGGVWTQLQDVHEALGLRYQWGGSHCNKVLLCCLGIDTRNILFTGQKKQPVIVPMYAASLGMLEPTKEPVKPVSAAEMIASIAQAPAALEKRSCSSDSVQQEALPPVQFDWSSSGLTNPLDGVDPELFELTTAKMDAGGSGSRVADAFARLMSTMEKTSTSTRKPRKDENLSEEASRVISRLPDLSFMQAKVLMFPATLTPLQSQARP